MDEDLLPDWNWNSESHYSGLGLANVQPAAEATDDDFDLDALLNNLDELLPTTTDQAQAQPQGSGESSANPPIIAMDIDEPAEPTDLPIPSSSSSLSSPIRLRTRSKTESPRRNVQRTPEVDHPEDHPNTKAEVKDLAKFVKELREELEILLFFQRKCYIHNLKHVNYIRQAPESSYSDVTSDLKRKFRIPYISVHTASGELSVPSSVQKPLPFLNEARGEWSKVELKTLEMCVFNSYYHRQHFFIDTRFQQMMLEMGFSCQELAQIDSVKCQIDKEIRPLMKNDRLTESEKAERCLAIESRATESELELIEEFVAQHKKDNKPIVPLPLCKGDKGTSGVKIGIDLKDLIAWKQHESRLLHMKRFNGMDEVVDEKNIDWLMVEKDVFSLTGRTESSAELKNIFKFCISKEFNHARVAKTELDRLKTLIQKQPNKERGIDWADMAKQLGTNRSPIRVFQTYRQFIYMKEHDTSEYMRDEKGKLAAFYNIRDSLGHAPRILRNLTREFGPVSSSALCVNWHEINPRFTKGKFYFSEDATLLVVMELYGADLRAGKKFSILQNRLPWRHCNVWRKRAEFLFKDCDKWTFEEDKLLLYAIKRFGEEWNGLCKVLPNKSKNSMVIRYHLLRKKLTGVTLSQYHSIYYRRDPKSNLLRLRRIATVLRKAINMPAKQTDTDKVIDIADTDGDDDEEDVEEEEEDEDDVEEEEDTQEEENVEGEEEGKEGENVEGDEGENEEGEEDTDTQDDVDKESIDEQQNAIPTEPMPITLTAIKKEIGPIRLGHNWIPISIAVSDSGNEPKPSTSVFQIDTESEENVEFLKEVLSSVDKKSPKQLQRKPEEACLDWKTPRDKNIFAYLKTFDPTIIKKTVERLDSYVKSQKLPARSSTAKESKSNQLALSCDRRKFIPTDPASVGSALQLRRVELKPITSEIWKNLSEFEKSVCQAYRSFSSGWRTKKQCVRPTIPTALSLSFLPSIRNIIKTARELEFDRLAMPPPPAPPALSSNSQKPSPQILTNQEQYKNIFLPGLSNYKDTSGSSKTDKIIPNVQLVPSNPTMVEAHNSLCRSVWNTSNVIKTKKTTQKARRKALNLAAAKARWDKVAVNKLKTSQNDEPEKRRKPWYTTLLKQFVPGTKECENGSDVGKDECLEEMDVSEPQRRLLNVLHDHAYPRSYLSSVSMAVEEMQLMLTETKEGSKSKTCESEDSDSAKENSEVNDKEINK